MNAVQGLRSMGGHAGLAAALKHSPLNYIKMSKKIFPIAEGWLHSKVKFTPGTKMTEATMLSFFGCNTDTHEVAKFECFKTCANLIFRKKRIEPMTDHQYEAALSGVSDDHPGFD